MDEKTAELTIANRSLELLYHSIARLYSGPVAHDTYSILLKDLENVLGVGHGLACLVETGDDKARVIATTLDPARGDVNICGLTSCAECMASRTLAVHPLKNGTRVLTLPLADSFDLVCFKSMLHDWPEKEAREFIAKGAQALKPGGTLLIFERGPIEVDKGTLPYSAIPMLLFFHSFRGPSLYIEQLRALRFENINVQRIDLEMPFYLVAGVRPYFLCLASLFFVFSKFRAFVI